MRQNLLDAVPVGIAQKQAVRGAPDLAEPLAAFADGRRVHNWQHLFHVARDKRIEDGFVVVEQVAQKRILLEVAAKPPEDEKSSRDLIFERADVRRQQAVQRENVALLLGESRSLVEQRVVDELEAGESGFHEFLRHLRLRVARLVRAVEPRVSSRQS